MSTKKKGGGFESFGLTSAVYNGIKRKGFRIPTPIQRKAIPTIMEGRDVCAMARTGSGKTAAFLLPLFERLRTHSTKYKGPRAIIVAPTRELALQTVHFIKQLGKFLDLRTAVIIGGESMIRDYEAISSHPDIIVCTPGRMVHHMHEIADLSLAAVEIIVLDETDRLFEMGLSDQVREILAATPDSRQTLMFSATMPKLLAEFTRAGLRDPTLIRLDAEGRLSDDLQLHFFTVKPHEKVAALLYLLHEIIPAEQQTMVFVATRHHVEYFCELLRKSGLSVVMAYGSMDQTARRLALDAFKSRKAMVMVVTDVAARGLDIPMLDNVINADFPPSSKLFIHRVGRVARAGRAGSSYSFATSDEIAFVIELHLFLGREMSELGTIPASLTDTYAELITTLHAKHTDLNTMARVVTNAEKAYKRTRVPPSGESVHRAKALLSHPLAPHTLVADKNDTSSTMLQDIRLYRPSASVFDLKGLGRNTAKTASTPSTDPQPLTRRIKTKRVSRPLRNDDDIHMSHVPDAEDRIEREERHRELRAAGYSRVEEAVLDLVPDDTRDLLRRKNVLMWDRKRKRYVGQDGESSKKQRVLNEAGVMVSEKSKGGTYAQWKKRQGGRFEINANVINAPDRRNRWKNKPQMKAESELQRPEQIAKTRRRKEKLAHLHTRGKTRRRNKK